MSDKDQKQNNSFSAAGDTDVLSPHFLHIVSLLMTQALVDLGQVPNPLEKDGVKTDLKRAKYVIDLLGILEEKTKGNLTDEENKALSSTLSQLRLLYVQAAK